MTEVEITNMKKEVDYWTEYKDKGQHQHAKQIRALEGEVEDMNFSFNEMKGKFAKILDTEIKTIKNIFFHFSKIEALIIHVINFKEASGRFFFNLLEVF